MTKPCCQNAANLRLQTTPKPGERLDTAVRVCVICGARHHTMYVDPGKFGLTGKRLG